METLLFAIRRQLIDLHPSGIDVSAFVVDGSNTIELRFNDDAQTNYLIQSLAIIQS